MLEHIKHLLKTSINNVLGKDNGMNKVYKTDGVDHIRVHLSGKTELGRKLSEFYIRPFTTLHHGEFNHLVGYSLWLKNGMEISQLRHLAPFECLKLIKNTSDSNVWNNDFYKHYADGVKESIKSDAELYHFFIESDLPFIAYRDVPGDLLSGERTWIAKFLNEHRVAEQARLKESTRIVCGRS